MLIEKKKIMKNYSWLSGKLLNLKGIIPPLDWETIILSSEFNKANLDTVSLTGPCYATSLFYPPTTDLALFFPYKVLLINTFFSPRIEGWYMLICICCTCFVRHLDVRFWMEFTRIGYDNSMSVCFIFL